MKRAIYTCILILSTVSGLARGRDRLSERTFLPGTLFAASAQGTLLTVHGNNLELWSESGKLLQSCEVADPRLQGLRNSVALHGELALLSFLDPEAGKEDNRKLVLVNVEECRVVSSFSLPGVILAVKGSPLGWLAVNQAANSQDYEYSLVDNDGQRLASFQVPEELSVGVKARGLPPGPCSPVAVRDRVVLVSKATYELWAPAQKGRPPRKLPMPECLYLEGEWLSGEASERELRRRIANASDETRRIIEEFLQKGGSHRGFMAAVRGVSTYRDRLAVLLRDPSLPGGCRLDIWDLTREVPLLITAIADTPCPDRFFSLVGDGLWVFRENRLEKVPLGPMEDPLAHPCKALAALRGTSAAADPGTKSQ